MSTRWRRWAAFWAREPLLSYAMGGGLVFALLSPYLPTGKETLFIDVRTMNAVIARQTNIEGRELTVEEREQAIEDYVREEILLREGYRHGWHLDSGRVRQRLLLAMRSALMEDLPAPSTAQLRAFYLANAERYRTPPSVTFSHVFFESLPASDAVRVLQSLNAGAEAREMGDRFWLGDTMVRQTRHQLAQALGASFADLVFALEQDSWAGPHESNRGTHFVKLLERRPETLPELDAVERLVRADWITRSHEEIRERKLRRIRERYTVRREPSP